MLSDHSPIILECMPKKSRRSSPYKLEAWCLFKADIEANISQNWKKFAPGSHLFRIQRRLECIVGDSRK